MREVGCASGAEVVSVGEVVVFCFILEPYFFGSPNGSSKLPVGAIQPKRQSMSTSSTEISTGAIPIKSDRCFSAYANLSTTRPFHDG